MQAHERRRVGKRFFFGERAVTLFPRAAAHQCDNTGDNTADCLREDVLASLGKVRIGVVAMLVALPGFAFAQQAVRTAPAAVRMAVEQGNQALQHSQFAAAEAAFRKALDLAPNLTEVRANLGLAYYAGHQYPQAIETFQRIEKEDPKLTTPHAFLPLSLAAIGHCQEAIPGLRREFTRYPDLQLRRVLGLSLQRCLEATGDQAGLVNVTGQLVQQYPRDIDVLYESGRIYGQLSSGLYLKILKLAPHSPRGYQLTAQVLASEGKWQEAIQSDRKALEMAPGMPGLHLQIATLLLTSSTDPNAWQQGEAELEKELQVAPDSAAAEYELGEVWRKHGHPVKAEQALQAAIRLAPGLTDARLSLAKLLQQQKRPRQALAVLEPARAGDPNNAEVHFLLAQLYRDLGKPEEAQQEMQAFQRLQPAGR